MRGYDFFGFVALVYIIWNMYTTLEDFRLDCNASFRKTLFGKIIFAVTIAIHMAALIVVFKVLRG